MTTIPKLTLISFKICPFVQRSVITLLHKKIDFDVEFIDLKKKPAWFLKISPMGKVPVLKAGDDVLFESAVINEYLDEITPPLLHPSDPLLKAKNRAWIEFGSGLLMSQYQLATVSDQQAFGTKLGDLEQLLNQLEEQLTTGPFFNGEDFSLIDTAFAPLFIRLDILDSKINSNIIEMFPKLKNWKKNLLEVSAVKASIANNFEELYLGFIKSSDSYFANNYLK